MSYSAQENSPFVFISYSHPDKEYAVRLKKFLEGKEIKSWMYDRIPFGKSFPEEIERQIEQCVLLLLVVSSDSKKSKWVRKEVQYALKKDKEVLPLSLDKDIMFIDLGEATYEDVSDGSMPSDDFTFYLQSNIYEEQIDLDHEVEPYGIDSFALNERVEHLFTPYLTMITLDGFSDEWKGFEVDNGGEVDYCLFPFKPEILRILSPEDIARNTEGRFNDEGGHYVVSLNLEGRSFVRRYAVFEGDDYMIDSCIAPDTFDLRVFPDIDLEHPQINSLLPHEGDGYYFARVRLSPYWLNNEGKALHIVPTTGIRDGNGRLFHREMSNAEMKYWKVGHNRDLGQVCPLGEVLFFEMYRKPSAFYIEDRGLVFFKPRTPPHLSQNPIDWEIAIDFRPSKTSIAYHSKNYNQAMPLELPGLASTLLRIPKYSVMLGISKEGAAAVLDFFYKYIHEDFVLTENATFPSHLLTTEVKPGISNDEIFNLRNGLIWFREMTFENAAEYLPLINGYNSVENPDADFTLYEQRYHLRKLIRWEDEDWLVVFMQHLRKHIVLAAAYQNARIERIAFSYPAFFSTAEVNHYRNTLEKVWNPKKQERKIPLWLSNEIKGIRNIIVEKTHQYLTVALGKITTDLTMFSRRKPIGKSQFSLGIAQLERYIFESATFRKVFFASFAEGTGFEFGGIVTAKYITPEVKTIDEQLQLENYWTTLLKTIEAHERARKFNKTTYELLQEKVIADESREVMKGFFMSLTVFFTGFAFYAGMLCGAASKGKLSKKAFRLRRIDLRFTGEGRMYYLMLNALKSRFDNIMKRMFLTGVEAAKGEEIRYSLWESGVSFTPFEEPFSSTAVARGILSPNDKEYLDVPTLNVVGEKEFGTLDGNEFDENSMVDLINAVNREEHAHVPEEPPYYLQTFLDKLHQLLPKGNSGNHCVIPGLEKGWHKEIKETLYQSARIEIEETLFEHADQFYNRNDVAFDESNSRPIEPVFMIQISALLKVIREKYAN